MSRNHLRVLLLLGHLSVWATMVYAAERLWTLTVLAN
jgi:hypothetical protein